MFKLRLGVGVTYANLSHVAGVLRRQITGLLSIGPQIWTVRSMELSKVLPLRDTHTAPENHSCLQHFNEALTSRQPTSTTIIVTFLCLAFGSLLKNLILANFLALDPGLLLNLGSHTRPRFFSSLITATSGSLILHSSASLLNIV